jgi:uncharacterized protein (DUF58 family)
MVDLNRSFTATSTFVLTPVVEPLPGLPLPRSWDTGENLGSHSIGAHGADDASTREYRRGDDLRKIHWRSTARAGALMVRHEERPWQGHSVVLLDSRSRAHQTAPRSATTAGGDARDSSSLEWAISATASIASHLLSNQREVSLVVGAAGARHSNADAAGLLDTLAGIEAHRGADLSDIVDPLRDVGREATLIAILGRLDPVSLRILTRLHSRGAPAFAVILDTGTWLGPSLTDPLLPNAMATLQVAGWTVVVAKSGDSVPAIWAGLMNQRADRSLGSMT